MQKLVDKLSDITDFNPRSHEGSDYDKRERLNTDDKFQSTLPRGERRYSPGTVHRQWHYFNPRSHEGSDDVLMTYASEIRNFNPRSHEGSDQTGL